MPLIEKGQTTLPFVELNWAGFVLELDQEHHQVFHRQIDQSQNSLVQLHCLAINRQHLLVEIALPGI